MRFIILVALVFISNCTKKEIIFAGGFQGGTFYSFADSISKIPDSKVKVLVSNGSLDNIYKIADKKANFSLTQLDMYRNVSISESDISSKIKILMPILSDEVHVVARKNIKNFSDLIGKKIATGHAESGIKATAITILAQNNVRLGDIIIEEIGPELGIPKLLKNEIDAVIVVSSLPVKILSDIPESESKNIHILNFPKKALDKVKPISIKAGEKPSAHNVVYQTTTIPEKTYPFQNEEINTILVQSVLITHVDTSNSENVRFLNLILNNRDYLQKINPQWKELNDFNLKEKMARDPEIFDDSFKSIVK